MEQNLLQSDISFFRYVWLTVAQDELLLKTKIDLFGPLQLGEGFKGSVPLVWAVRNLADARVFYMRKKKLVKQSLEGLKIMIEIISLSALEVNNIASF